MSEFNFYLPIEVRYGDLDPQGHVNNAKYLTYMEQARIEYIHQSGLWEGGSFQDIGIILANAQITFQASIRYGQPVRVGVRVSRLGNKSMTMEYRLEDAQSGEGLASASTTVVTYDYRTQQTIPIPDHWRKIIGQIEGLAI
jgi:acyl-CoA thioester hydrolase